MATRRERARLRWAVVAAGVVGLLVAARAFVPGPVRSAALNAVAVALGLAWGAFRGWAGPGVRRLFAVVEPWVPMIVLAVAMIGLAVAIGWWWRARVARAAAAAQARRDRVVGSVDDMTGPEFERLVARLMRRDGMRDVRVPGGAGDLGADVLARRPGGRRVVVQCKRYALLKKVGSPEVQRFLGTVFDEHLADEGWLVTNSRFTAAARDLGGRRGLVLVDRDRLATWMADGALPGPPSPSARSPSPSARSTRPDPLDARAQGR